MLSFLIKFLIVKIVKMNKNRNALPITTVSQFAKYIQSSRSIFERVFDIIFMTLDIFKSCLCLKVN